MTIALIDNGSLAGAAHLNLRKAAEALSSRTGEAVSAVSWKHSDRIPGAALGASRAWTLKPWIRARVARGERDFLLVPFFISPAGAIGSALQRDLDALDAETGGFSYRFCEGLASGPALASVVSARVREAVAERGLRRPSVIVVDHGGPSADSAAIRDRVAAEVREELLSEVGPLAAASMESPAGEEFGFSRPLLSERLGSPGFDFGDVVIAPLFLSPGRHAGPEGDLARIAAAATARFPGLRCHLAGLVGTHPGALEALCEALREALPAHRSLPS